MAVQNTAISLGWEMISAIIVVPCFPPSFGGKNSSPILPESPPPSRNTTSLFYSIPAALLVKWRTQAFYTDVCRIGITFFCQRFGRNQAASYNTLPANRMHHPAYSVFWYTAQRTITQKLFFNSFSTDSLCFLLSWIPDK